MNYLNNFANYYEEFGSSDKDKKKKKDKDEKANKKGDKKKKDKVNVADCFGNKGFNISKKENNIIEALEEFLIQVHREKEEVCAKALVSYESAIQVYYRDYSRRSNNKKLTNTLIKKFLDKPVSKAFKSVIKDKGFTKPEWFIPLIYDILKEACKSTGVDKYDKVVNRYRDIWDDLVEKRSDKLSSKTRIPEKFTRELISIVPTKSYALSETENLTSNNIRLANLIGRLYRKLYNISKTEENTKYSEDTVKYLDTETTAQIHSMLKYIFGEDLLGWVAINTLLEKKSVADHLGKNLKMWNTLTTWALGYLEGCKRKELKMYFEYYFKQVGRDRGERRTKLDLPENEFPRVLDAIEATKKYQSGEEYDDLEDELDRIKFKHKNKKKLSNRDDDKKKSKKDKDKKSKRKSYPYPSNVYRFRNNSRY